MEVGDAEVRVAQRMGPAGREVHVLLGGGGLELGELGGDSQGESQATIRARERPRAETGKDEEVDGAPWANQREVHHRLAEPVFAVDVLHEIYLIDDVY